MDGYKAILCFVADVWMKISEKVQSDEKVFSDEHDVDIIGYGGASDDDHSSVRRWLCHIFLFA